MPGYKGTITVHGSQKIALECEEGDAAYAESVCATELKFYKDNVDPADMTSLKKHTQSMIRLCSLNRLMRPSWFILFLAIHPSSLASALTWI